MEKNNMAADKRRVPFFCFSKIKSLKWQTTYSVSPTKFPPLETSYPFRSLLFSIPQFLWLPEFFKVSFLAFCLVFKSFILLSAVCFSGKCILYFF